jgi:large subunit ribosomal protein L7/L12
MLRASTRVLPALCTRTCTASPALVQRVRFYAAEAAEAKSDKPIPPHVAGIVDQISKLNILEVSDLVKALQDKLGISGAIPMMAAGAPAAAAAPAASAAPAAAAPKVEAVKEQTEFNVRLTKVAENAKYKIIKELREIRPSLSLMETKGLVEKTPSVIMEKVSKEEASKIINKLKDAGGDCEMI